MVLVETLQVKCKLPYRSIIHTRDLVDGYVSQTFAPLAYSHYSVVVTYTGDDNYEKRSISKGFYVIRYGPIVTVTVDDINVTETAHINVWVW